MSRDRIKEELENALRDLRSASHTNPSAPEPNSIHRPLIRRHLRSQPLVSLLETLPGYAQQTDIVLTSGMGWTGFSPAIAAPKLLEVAEERGPEGALEWIERVLRTETAEALWVAALSGVTVEDTFTLWDGVEITPFENVPNSSYKEAVLQEASMSPWHWGFGQGLTAALIKRVTVSPVLRLASETGDNKTSAKSEPGDAATRTWMQTYSSLTSICRALTLIGPSSPAIDSIWLQFIDPDLQKATLGARSIPGQELRRMAGDASRLVTPADSRTIEAYFSLQAEVREKVDVSLDRLNQAIRRRTVGDKAIDTAIALEALLAKEGEKSEILYRLGLRAALILGGDLSTRRTNRNLIKAFYTLRSRVAHGEAAPATIKVPGQGAVPSIELAESAVKLCGELLNTLIRHGELPDLEDLELQGGFA
ncbi:HEPN domain-containing protein [Microvirga calopogonii]|uniref:HEPN domain-containing protein n=1 Tax=Microvirga calopogonii TaxID=2078013 RepID=UPI0013B39E96|nr:HEPN domain-containing protein [Microvirga calopogonii]